MARAPRPFLRSALADGRRVFSPPPKRARARGLAAPLALAALAGAVFAGREQALHVPAGDDFWHGNLPWLVAVVAAFVLALKTARMSTILLALVPFAVIAAARAGGSVLGWPATDTSFDAASLPAAELALAVTAALFLRELVREVME